MKHLLTIIIRAYQKTLSPDHGFLSPFFPHGFCRFYPSCSEYGRQSIEKYGTIKGVALGAKRILRCNPLNEPAIDNVNNEIIYGNFKSHILPTSL